MILYRKKEEENDDLELSVVPFSKHKTHKEYAGWNFFDNISEAERFIGTHLPEFVERPKEKTRPDIVYKLKGSFNMMDRFTMDIFDALYGDNQTVIGYLIIRYDNDDD